MHSLRAQASGERQRGVAITLAQGSSTNQGVTHFFTGIPGFNVRTLGFIELTTSRKGNFFFAGIPGFNEGVGNSIAISGSTFKGTPSRLAFSMVASRLRRFGDTTRHETSVLEGGVVASMDSTAILFDLRRRIGEGRPGGARKLSARQFGCAVHVEALKDSVASMGIKSRGLRASRLSTCHPGGAAILASVMLSTGS